MTRIKLTKKAGFLMAVAGAAVIGGVSTALVQAAVPSSSDGQVHACYRNSAALLDPKGAVRVIDNQAGEACASYETGLNLRPQILRSDVTAIDFSGSNMNGWDLRGRDFTSATFYSTYVRGADMSNSNFTNAVVWGLDAGGASFSNANFTNINTDQGAGRFNHTNLNGADFSSNLRVLGIEAKVATMIGTNFTNVSIEGSDFTGSNMSNAALTGATWHNTFCPDGTNSDDHASTCIGHLVP